MLGIMIVLGRKVALIRDGVIALNKEEHPLLPDLIKIRNLLMYTLKRLGYILVVVSLRIYFKFVNLIKSAWENIKAKVKSKLEHNIDPSNPPQASVFLQKMSEYKMRIHSIKHRIKTEESE